MDPIVGGEGSHGVEIGKNDNGGEEVLVVAHGGAAANQATVEAPAVGMMFETVDELYEFYKTYARSIGFGIAKRGARKDDLTGQHRWQTIQCSKGREHKKKGSNLLSRRPSGRSGCKARICCTKKEGLWTITRVELEHNHEVKPCQARFMKQHRAIDVHMKRQLEAMQAMKSMVFQVGGHEEMPCLSVDLENHVNKFRRLHFVGSDAEALHQMFAKMQNENRGFFYSIKPDKEGRLKHVFWADGRSKAAYEEFGDVITFDTTYLVSKYDMPCVMFVGVNNHGQPILLGCALLNNEKCKTFTWLFETWLSCMGGKHPNAIITDQCEAIGNAIETIFPNTRHRWCIRYILRKFPTKLPKNTNYGPVKDAFMGAVYDSLSFTEFEESWGTMISNFQLDGNEWLSTLYNNRKRWVPVFLKSSFWAGMSSTQRNESMHSFFDGYVHSRSTLCQFIEQYELAIKDKIEKEVQEDFLSGHTQFPCVTRWPFELQLCRAYTNKIFKLVQKQIVDTMYCDLKEMMEQGTEMTYEVTEMIAAAALKRRRAKFVVKFDVETHEVNCSCHLFEFQGILCAHVFKVLTIKDVYVIPDRYILRRWRKDVGRCHSRIKVGSTNSSIESWRTKELEKIFYSAIDIAVDDLDKFEFFMNGLKENYHRLENWVVNSVTVVAENNVGVGNGDGGRDDDCEVERTAGIEDPINVKRRGRPKSKRML